jgi:hypothetical protein
MLLACGTMAAATERAYACGPLAPPTIVRTTHRFPNIPLPEAAAVLRRFATAPGAVTTDEAKGVIVVSETEDRMPRLTRVLRAMEQARPGDQVWLEPVRSLWSASTLAQKLADVLGLDTRGAAPGSLTSLVGDDESRMLVIVAEEHAYLRLLELIMRAQEGSSSRDEGRLSVLPLEHADAADIARDLQSNLAELRLGAGVASPGSGPVVSVDAATNSLVIRASSQEEIDALRKAARDLDQPRSQVLLDLIVAEAPASTQGSASGVVLGGSWIPYDVLSDEARRAISWSHDPNIVLEQNVLAKDQAPVRLLLAMDTRGARPFVPSCSAFRPTAPMAVPPHAGITITPHLGTPDQVRLALEVAACLAPSAPAAPAREPPSPCVRRSFAATVVVRDEQTFAVHVLDRDRTPRGPNAPGVERASLFIIGTPHRVRGQGDLRRLFERRMQERQAYLDHAFVFDSPRLPALHVDQKSKGLLAEIRLAQQVAGR